MYLVLVSNFNVCLLNFTFASIFLSCADPMLTPHRKSNYYDQFPYLKAIIEFTSKVSPSKAGDSLPSVNRTVNPSTSFS